MDEAASFVSRLPQSVEKESLLSLIEEMGLQLVCVDTDMVKALKRAGELAAESYTPLVAAQEGFGRYFCYITPLCFQRHMADHVEAHLRKACAGKTRMLWKTIHEYELMGYLNTQDLHAAEIYREIEEHFGALPVTERAFRAYR